MLMTVGLTITGAGLASIVAGAAFLRRRHQLALCIMATGTKTAYVGMAVAFVGSVISITHSPGPLADLVCSLLPCRE